MSTLLHFMKHESGVTAFEYGLIAAATGLAVAAIIPILENT